MRRIILFAVATLCSITISWTQSVRGFVTDSARIPIPGAAVAIWSPADSANPKAGVATDVKGYFEIGQVEEGRYTIQISCMGYQTIVRDLAVPSHGVLLDTIKMAEMLNELSTVRVQANYVQHKGEKTLYRIPPTKLTVARSAFELMNIVPEIRINPANQSIDIANCSSFLILINNVPSSQAELKAIQPQDVKSIEMYDTPPARYMQYDKVVNVTTYDRTQGYAAGISADQSVSPALGYTNGYGYVVYNKGKSTYALTHTYMRRKFEELISNLSYQFHLPTIDVDRMDQSLGRKNIHLNETSLYYVYADPAKQMLQVVLKPDFSQTNDSSKGEILAEGSKRTGESKNASKIFYPSADIFYKYILPNDQSLSANIVLTGYRTKQTYENHEKDAETGGTILDDETEQRNSKLSVIAQIDYTKMLGGNVFSIGTRYAGAALEANIKNLLGNNTYSSTQHSGNLYADYVHRLAKKWTFVGRMGVGYVYSKAYEGLISDFYPQTDLSAYYQINPHHKLSFKTTYSYSEPSLGLRSQNSRYVIQHLLYKGNPDLKGQSSWSANAQYTMSYNKLYLTVSPSFYCQWNAIFNNYRPEGQEMLQQPQNALRQTISSVSYSLRYSPFPKDLMTFTVNGSIRYKELTPRAMKQISYWETPINYQVDLTAGHFSAFYQGALFREYMSGLMILAGDVTSNIGVKYRIKNYTLSVSGIWFLTQPDQGYYTVNESLVRIRSNAKIRDQRTTIALGLSIDFSSGKTENSIRQLTNKDSDSGLF